jgi:hypothetical protein
VLDQLDIPHTLLARWGEAEAAAASGLGDRAQGAPNSFGKET